MQNHFSWSDTFQVFEDVSNENAAVGEQAYRLISDYLKTINVNKLVWLDIGSGDFRKLLYILFRLKKCFPNVSFELISYEPDLNQITNFTNLTMKALEQVCGKITIHETMFNAEDFLASKCTIDIFTSFHMMYDDEALDQVTRLVNREKVVKFGLMVCESKESAFAKIRSELRAIGIKTPFSRLSMLKASIPDGYFKISPGYIRDQHCYIDINKIVKDENHWFFPFIVGETDVEFMNRPLEERDTIKAKIREYVSSFGPTLSTDDEYLSIYSET